MNDFKNTLRKLSLSAVGSAALLFTSCGKEEEKDTGLRVKIEKNEYGLRVVGHDGTPLRGTSFITYAQKRTDGRGEIFRSREYWDRLQELGFNALRVAWFDPWRRSHGTEGQMTPWGKVDIRNEQDRAELLEEMDFFVEETRKRGMYLLINYHNTGGYQDPDYTKPAGYRVNSDGEVEIKGTQFPFGDTMEDLKLFWNIMAPRYKDDEHVFYEPMNEYVQWRPDNFTDEILADTAEIYQLVRGHAPNTHISLLTFANHVPANPEKASMLKVAKRLQSMGVDFENASVAFHPYNPKLEVHPEKYVLELMAEFPVINSEQNFPSGSLDLADASDNEWLDARGFEGDYMGVQSMERLGISWFHWNIESEKMLEKYWAGLLLPDAQKKGYLWFDWTGE